MRSPFNHVVNVENTITKQWQLDNELKNVVWTKQQ